MNPRKLIRLLLITRSLRIALHTWRCGLSWLDLERRGNRVFMKGTNIPCDQLPSLLTRALSYQIGLLAPFGFSFEVADNQGKNCILVDTGEVKLWLDNAEAAYLVQEVFGNREYGVLTLEPSIVIDIGMNVATTALYFAKEPAVKRVVAFEPSMSTIRRAERNLAINPELARKIEVRPYALGERSGEAHLQLYPNQSSWSKIAHGPDPEQNNLESVAVEMRDAEAELRVVLAETGEDECIILNVDCEGSEREIFRRLSLDTLSGINVITLEWHHPDLLREIRDKLQEIGFHLLERWTGKDIGMLYAFRR